MNKSVARGSGLAPWSGTSFYAAGDAHLIRGGFNPGAEKGQCEKGVAPDLLRRGYKIEYKDFSDGIQVNDAVARGDIEANIMQN
ncbi:MetQ/NlpA family ABC transporter substrate-binding protein, partial [Escherichia coli]|uniref:MetQ/NlpA family ABC transporter substrate-binding protein n=1 Tax=Escherichia coli TaxID=562 RepID=UPI001692258A